jgi:hypothetical protein
MAQTFARNRLARQDATDGFEMGRILLERFHSNESFGNPTITGRLPKEILPERFERGQIPCNQTSESAFWPASNNILRLGTPVVE